MNIIALIIKREYLSRVKKKSFIIMTILGPILMAALLVGPTLLAQKTEDTGMKVIAVLDNKANHFEQKLESKKNIQFVFIKGKTKAEFLKGLGKEQFYAFLYNSDEAKYSVDSITLASTQQPSIQVKSFISSTLSKKIEREKLKKLGIDEAVLNSIKTEVDIKTLKMNADGDAKKSSSELITVIAYVASFMIYMFVLMYGIQIMRGVMEEKTSRIVEVIISSVKPFQLMMGKILGIALVALTQFGAWIVLSLGIFFVSRASMSGSKSTNEIFEMISTVPWGMFIFAFVFFFIGGYLLYGSLYAAVGSAVDSETDTQQFMMPISLPLIAAIMLLQPALTDPNGMLARVASIIPFSSPIIMVARIPFGVPWIELIISMLVLVASFIGLTWVAARIYRTGILMYGKKISYAELWKWLKYKG